MATLFLSKPPKPFHIDTASRCCAMILVTLMLMSSLRLNSTVQGRQLSGGRACEEIYVVGEGETLHMISDKCGDPFIIERNPHIHDPDDVFPGLVIKITPSSSNPV